MQQWKKAAAIIIVGVGSLVACQGDDQPPTTPSKPSVISLSGNLAFGNVTVGGSATSTLTIANSGGSVLNVSNIAVTNGIEAVLTASWLGGQIAPGSSQRVTMVFTPRLAQTYSGTVTVNGDQSSGASSMAVSGTGTSASFPCSYSLSVGATIDGYPSGGVFPVTVTTGSGCAWTTTSSVSWIRVSGAGSGAGNGVVTLNEDANGSGSSRTGIVTIAGRTITFNQSATSQTSPPPPGNPAPPVGNPGTSVTMKWSLKNSCNVEQNLKFYDKNNHLVWPSASTHYTLSPGSTQTYNLSCTAGAKICVGGNTASNGTGASWGVGLSNNQSCSNCCYTCVSGNVPAQQLTCTTITN